MAVSEAIYGNTTSYISSSGYYGFVPQNNQQPAASTSNWCSSSSSGSWDVNVNVNTVNVKETSNGNWQNHNQNQTHGGAMETDDYVNDADIVNNYCVITDPALRGISPTPVYSNYLEGRNNPLRPSGFGALDLTDATTTALRRNRKRNNDGQLVLVEPDQFKRLRKGSGNCCTYHGRGIAKDGGLAKVHYKSARLCINRWKDIDQDEELGTFESFCWSEGNHSCLVNNDDTDKGVSLIGNIESKTCNLVDVEYEKMLLETHGCSAYHHHRLQSQNENLESEF